MHRRDGWRGSITATLTALLGAVVALSACGGDDPGGASVGPGALTLEIGPNAPDAAIVLPGLTDVVVAQWRLHNPMGGGTRVTGLKARFHRSVPPPTLSSISLVVDEDGDGAFTAADRVIDPFGVTLVNGVANFSGLNEVIGGGATHDWLVVVDADALSEIGTLRVSLTAADVTANSVATSGTVTPTATPDPLIAALAGAGLPTFSWIAANIFERSDDPLGQRCAVSGCHGEGSQLSSLNLDSLFSNVRADDLLQPAAQAPLLDRVAPFLPDLSYLVHKVEGTALLGDQMPRLAEPLAPAELLAIRLWVLTGALDN